MVTIDRDYQYGRGDRYTIKLSEPGMGVRAMVIKRATLREAQIAIAHYYEPQDASHKQTCLVCKTLAEQRERELKQTARRERHTTLELNTQVLRKYD